MQKVILVNEQDEIIGEEEKIKAHQQGLLHRAFSIFIFNHQNELLLQQRALSKYHTPGLWTNTCCSHPRPGEELKQATRRRLKEEMGFDCELKEIFNFIYKVKFSNDLYEHELDHVFVGQFEGQIEPNPEEAESHQWKSLEWVQQDIEKNPEKYTPWFKIILERYLDYLK